MVIMIGTRRLTLRILDDESKDIINVLLTTRNCSLKRFTLREVFSLFGLVPILTLTTQWVKCDYIALHHDVLLAIKFNSNTVFTSIKFKNRTDLLTCKSVRIKKLLL